MPDCEHCTEKCPQAEMAHEIAKGRMYAMQELVRMVKEKEAPPITNADLIRAMSDEELAGFLWSNEWGHFPRSEKGWLDWLKSPAEGTE